MVIFISLMLTANEREGMRKSFLPLRHLGNNFTLGGTNSLLTDINVICKNTAVSQS